jgi:hypothetical protein
VASTDKRLIRPSQAHTAAEPAGAVAAQRASPSWLDGSPRMATQRQQLDHLFGAAAQRRVGPGEEASQGGPIVQRRVYYPPLPTHITEQQAEQWNAFLDTWGTQVTAAGLDGWVDDAEGTMWDPSFNFATSMGSLRQQIRAHILTYVIDLGEAVGIDWDQMLGVIRLIEPAQLCTVNISVNVDYDGSKGNTWYVKGKVTGRDQRGGWKYNAMEKGYLPNARTQVRTALEIHNAEVALFAQTV